METTRTMRGAAVVALLLAAGGGTAAADEVHPKAKELTAQASWLPSKLKTRPTLAVTIEISAEGAKVLSQKVVRVPPPPNQLHADLIVRVLGAGDKVVHEYRIPDPRIVEIEREGTKVLPKGTAIIYAPLGTDMDRIELVPVQGREKATIPLQRVPLRDLAKKACAQRGDVRECAPLLAP